MSEPWLMVIAKEGTEDARMLHINEDSPVSLILDNLRELLILDDLRELHRLRVEVEAWRSGRLWDYNGGYHADNSWYPTIDDAIDALMADREER